jgi:HPt (histidine-containing phosphotransfer) domain-containing protein/two-component sensor histidine kinase
VSLLVVGAGGYGAYWSINRVNQLRSLQIETQRTLTAAYRLLVATEEVSTTAERLRPFFDEWQSELAATGAGIAAVTAHPALSRVASPDSAESVRIGWASAAGLFSDATAELEQIMAGEVSGIITPTGISNMAFQLRQRGVSDSPGVRDEEIAFVRNLERRMHNATVNLDFFVTGNLAILAEEIGRETEVAVRQTVLAASSIGGVLLVGAIAALLVGLRMLEQANVTLEERVQMRTQSIRSLLDFSGQGFLSFSDDFRVGPEWSRECATIFERDVSGADVAELLYDDETARCDFRDAVSLVFAGESRSEVVFDLLDSHLTVGGKSIEVEFREINSKTIMCSVSDVTERERMEERLREQAQLRDMLLSVVEHRDDFAALLQESQRMLEALHRVRDGIVPDSTIRMIHTFKANAAFLKLQNTAAAAHTLEQDISDAQLLADSPPSTQGIRHLREAFESEIALIEEHLGSGYVTIDPTVVVPRRRITDLEAALQAAGVRNETVERRLRELQTVRLSSMNRRLNSLTRNLADQRGKRLAPVVLDGDDAAVGQGVYTVLVDALTHIVRNTVDHGIERPRGREEAGKDPEGHITVVVKESGESLQVAVEDDGRGIDFDAVRLRAIEGGIIGADEQLDRAQLFQLVFRDGFSTAGSVSPVSGRGEGLAAVREMIYGIGGRIAMSTRAARGTRFVLTVPRYLREERVS